MPKASKSKTKAKDAIALRPDGLRKGSAGGALVDAVCKKAGLTAASLSILLKPSAELQR